MGPIQLLRLSYVLRDIVRNTTQSMGSKPLSLSALAIFDVVARAPGCTVGYITRETGFAQSLVSKQVMRFRDQGLFEVRQNPSDKRANLVSINSATAEEALSLYDYRTINEGIQRTFPNITLGQVNSALHGLTVVVDSLINVGADQ